MAKFYYSGQGEVWLAPIVNGVEGAYVHIGNVPTLEISNEITKLEHKESTSGKRLTDKTLIQEIAAGFSLTMEDWGRKNLAIALQGTLSAIAAASVTAESVGLAGNVGSANAMKVGDMYPLKFGNILSTPAPVVKDSTTPTALTLVAADYELDRKYGSIKVLRTTTTGAAPIVGPYKIDYSYGDQAVVALLNAARVTYALRLHAINTAENDKPMLAQLWQLDLDPSQTLPLIQDEIAQFTLEGSVLADATKAADPELGSFGRITYYGTDGA